MLVDGWFWALIIVIAVEFIVLLALPLYLYVRAMTKFGRALKVLLDEVYTPEGVYIALTSRLRLGGSPRTWQQYFADGEDYLVFDWAESLAGGSAQGGSTAIPIFSMDGNHGS